MNMQSASINFPFPLLYSGVQPDAKWKMSTWNFDSVLCDTIKNQSLCCRNAQVTGPQNEDLRSSTPGYILQMLSFLANYRLQTQAANTVVKWVVDGVNLLANGCQFMHPAVMEHASPKSTLVLGLALVSNNSFKKNKIDNISSNSSILFLSLLWFLCQKLPYFLHYYLICLSYGNLQWLYRANHWAQVEKAELNNSVWPGRDSLLPIQHWDQLCLLCLWKVKLLHFLFQGVT